MRLLILIFSLCFLILNSACHKETIDKTPVPLGTIVAEINGTKTYFNVNAAADTITSSFDFYRNSFILSVIGAEDTSSKSTKIKVWFMTVPAQPVGTGTYDDLNKQIYVYIDFKKIWSYSVNGYEPYVCTATITSIDTTVQGYFSGKVIVGIDSTGGQAPLSYTIKNGKFNVKIR